MLVQRILRRVSVWTILMRWKEGGKKIPMQLQRIKRDAFAEKRERDIFPMHFDTVCRKFQRILISFFAVVKIDR